jgi:predicted transcriptional regulator
MKCVFVQGAESRWSYGSVHAVIPHIVKKRVLLSAAQKGKSAASAVPLRTEALCCMAELP